MGRSQLSEQMGDIVYESFCTSGQIVYEVSGAVKVHDIVVTKPVSGLFLTVWDAAYSVLSGGATLKGKVYFGQEANPVVVPFDCRLKSGLSIIVSGNVWLVATYK